jgi:transposase
MRKTKEVLRLRFEVGLGLRQIARSCSIGLGTVHEYLYRAEAAGVTWPLGEGWDDERLEAALFGRSTRARPAVLPMPDFAELHRQRQVHPHLTQQLLWEEYRQANPDGYRYSRFCELFKRWRRKQDVVLRQEHKAGEKLCVDWAGTTISIYDPSGGPVQQAHLFVAVLGASSYTYAEATRDEQLASWIGAHVRAFEFYQGVPKLVVPDNTKTGVTKAAATIPTSTRRIRKWPCTTAWVWFRRGPTSQVTRPRSNRAYSWLSILLFLRYEISRWLPVEVLSRWWAQRRK